MNFFILKVSKFTELLRDKENAPRDKDRLFPLACVSPKKTACFGLWALPTTEDHPPSMSRKEAPRPFSGGTWSSIVLRVCLGSLGDRITDLGPPSEPL